MQNKHKTEEQGIDEVAELRRRIAELEAVDAERKQAEEEARQKARDLTLINALNVAANRGDSIQEIIHLLTEGTKKIGFSDGATAYLVSDDKKYLVMQSLVLSLGMTKRIERLIGIKIPRIQLPLKAGSLYLETLQRSEPQLINDPAAIQRLTTEFVETISLSNRLREPLRKLVPQILKVLGIRSVILVPLLTAGKAIGLLEISSKKPLTKSDLHRLEVLSAQLAIIINHRQAAGRLKHLNAVLRSVRSVNQLIVREKNRERLLQGICKNLINDLSYYHAWIALLDKSGAGVMTVEAGLGETFLPLAEQLQRGVLPACCRKALAQPGIVITTDPHSDCTDCPLANQYGGRGAMTARLEHNGKIYGLMTVSVPGDFVTNAAGQSLFSEVAGDIAFALHNIEVEEGYHQAVEAVQESEERYRSIVEYSHAGIFIVDGSYRFTYINDELCRILDRSRQEIVGHDFREFLDEESRELVADRYVRRQQGEEVPSRYEFNIIHPDGEKRRVEISSSVIRDATGAGQVKTVAQILDITERKRAEEDTRRRAERLAAINRVASAASGILEMNELLEAVSREIASIFRPDAFFVALYDEETNELDFRIRVDEGVQQPEERQPMGVGMISHVIGEAQPLLVRNFEQEKDHLPEAGFWGTMKAAASWLGVPMRIGDRVTGAVSVQAYRPNAYGEEEQQLLATIADQVAMAVENARLYQETQQRLTELTALHQTALNITAQLETPRLLDSIVERAVGLVGATGGLVHLYDPVAERLIVVTSLGLEKDYTGLRLRVGEGGAGRAFQNGEPLIVADRRTWAGRSPQVVDADARSVICVPLKWQDRVIGVLDIMDNRRANAFGERDLRILGTFAAQAAIAIQNARFLEQIQQQARQIQQILDSVPDGVLLIDANHRVVLANPIARDHLAVLANAAVEDTLTHLGGRPLAELLIKPAKGLPHEVKTENRVFEVRARPMGNGSGSPGQVLVISEVTQVREVQRRLQQQERLAAVGQLAAGIAHDFNNILAVILLYAQMERKNAELLPKTRKHLETIAQQAKRASDLIEQVLDFSRRAVLERRAMNLLPFLKEQVKLLERTLPEHIEIRLHYGDKVYMINADPTRIEQIFLNLAVNARDALPDGGTLRLKLERIQVMDHTQAPIAEMAAGEWVRITVADTGTGIPPENLPHIFDPFFTTKEVGKGTGLGLSQVYGIVKQHGGYIDVSSKLGEGTTFTIYLPAIKIEKPDPLAMAISETPRGNGETILLVEDNTAIREAMTDFLTSSNYRVLTAANGRDALAILAQCDRDASQGTGSAVALVISALIMPVMGGEALFRALRKQYPEIKMIILTGYPEKQLLPALREEGLADYLIKPLTVEQLGRAVARVLERGSGLDQGHQ